MDKDDGKVWKGGFYSDRGEGRGPRVAHCKIDELPNIDADKAAERLENLKKNQDPLKTRVTKLASMSIPSDVLDAGDPSYARCVRQAAVLRKQLAREFYIDFGFVSAAVSMLLSSSALATAASRFLYETSSGCEESKKDAKVKMASSLSDSARQNLLSAYELCAKQSVVRKRNATNTEAAPWLVNYSGDEKRPRGRPRKNPQTEVQKSPYGEPKGPILSLTAPEDSNAGT